MDPVLQESLPVSGRIGHINHHAAGERNRHLTLGAHVDAEELLRLRSLASGRESVPGPGETAPGLAPGVNEGVPP